MVKHIPFIYWFFLALAIAGEVIGTSTMKASQTWEFYLGEELGLVIMWTCIAFAYYWLARATVVLPIGVAFALWDGFGLVFIATFSFLFLGETITLTKSIGLICVIIGGLLVHHGTDNGHEVA